MYPKNIKKNKSKLKLLFQVVPISFIVEKAGGLATDGSRRLLDIVPTQLHDTTPMFIGSSDDVRQLESYLAGSIPNMNGHHPDMLGKGFALTRNQIRNDLAENSEKKSSVYVQDASKSKHKELVKNHSNTDDSKSELETETNGEKKRKNGEDSGFKIPQKKFKGNVNNPNTEPEPLV